MPGIGAGIGLLFRHGISAIMNMLSNTGAAGTTDWLDDNSDGVANGWLHSQGSGTPAIISGSGFVGNAQRINHVSGLNTFFNYAIETEIDLFYRISLKYRADVSGWRIYLRITSDSFITNIPINAGTPIKYTKVRKCTATVTTSLNFYKYSADGNGNIDIDEVVLVEETQFLADPEFEGGWITGVGWDLTYAANATIAAGLLTWVTGAAGEYLRENLSGLVVLNTGIYKVEFKINSFTVISGTPNIKPRCGGTYGTARTAPGTYSEEITWGVNTYFYLYISGSGSCDAEIEFVKLTRIG